MVSLAVADCLVGVAFFPAFFFCEESIICGVYENWRTLMPALFIWFCVDSSDVCVCAMVLERYVAIVWPLKYDNIMSKRRMRCLIALPWIISLLFAVIFPVAFRLFPQPATAKIYLTYFRVGTVFLDIVPSTILFAATLHMFSISRKHSKAIRLIVAQLNFNLPEGTPKILIASRKSHDSRQFRVVAVMVAVFITCNMLFCFFFFSSSEFSERTSSYRTIVSFVLVNSALNPVVYSFLKKDIKREVRRFICDRRKHTSQMNGVRLIGALSAENEAVRIEKTGPSAV